MFKALLIMFAVMQGIAILLGMINAGDWNISHWDAATRNAVATIPVTIVIILIMLYFAGGDEKEGKK